MRIALMLLLTGALYSGAVAQPCGPCGPCGPSGPSGGVNPGGPMLGPGDREMNGGGRDADSGPQARFRNDQDVLDYVRERYGNNLHAARNDPRVADYIRGLEGESRYVFQDTLSQNHDHAVPKDPGIIRIPGTATNDYYCHDFAWRQGDKSPPPGGHVDPNPILANPELYGYTKNPSGPLQSGDIVVYHQTSTGTADHSGLVVRVIDGVVYMISKDVGNSLFRHTLDSPNNYFRGAYGAAGVTVIRPGTYAVPPVAGGPPKPAASGP